MASSTDIAVASLTIESIGSADLEVVSVLVEGAGFSTASSFPMKLDPGNAAAVYIEYTGVSDADTGTATVISNDPDSGEIVVPLSGTFAGPQLLIEPEALNFETQLMDCDDTEHFTLTNIGTETLTLDEVLLEDDSGAFSLVELPQQWSLEPLASQTVEIGFSPGSSGDFVSIMHVRSNDPRGAQEADVVGFGDALGQCAALELSFIVEYEKADIAFLLDTTTSMGAMAGAIASEFGDIATTLNGEISDVTFGVGIFKDYSFGGTSADYPFLLLNQQTSSVSQVQSALSGISLSGGYYDLEEATMEAIYQATTGNGYDQDCDGVYDTYADVLPFHATSTDAFEGAANATYNAAIPGTGDLGGMGFRDNVLPVIILGTDAPLRDPDSGSLSPGGCSQDAGKSDARAGLNALGAGLIGVGVNGAGSYITSAGIADVVVDWNPNDDSFQDTVVDAVLELIGEAVFDEVWLDVTSDAYTMVDAIEPDRWSNVTSGTAVDFTVTANSALLAEASADTYPVTLELHGSIGAQEWLLDTTIINVLIPE